MDILTREKRSWNMSRIRSKDTAPEMIVRSFLYKGGFRFQLHSKKLPGKPDILLPKYKTALFVHGCFWHRHKGCRYAYSPKSRKAFWKAKFKDNINRFLKVKKELEKAGWRVVVIWECQIIQSNLQKLAKVLKRGK